MKHHSRWLILVLGLGVTCGEPTPAPPPVPPPQRSVPELPGKGDFALGPFPTPFSVEDAAQVLLSTKVFAFGNMPPKRQVQAFNLLLDQPDANTRFATIAARGDTAGKLYALCAFLALDVGPPMALASELEVGGARLLVQDSDVVLGFKTGSEVVALIRTRRLWEEMRRAKEETTKYFDKAG